MTRTRRQKAAAAATTAESEPTSPATSAPPVITQPVAAFAVDIPEDLDFDVLSSLLPDARFDSVTPDVVLHLFRLVVTQAAEGDATHRELEDTRAELSRKDVELDQALQDRETATRDLESTLDSVQKELDQVKHEKEEIIVAKAALQAQLTAISTSQTSSSAEVETLKSRVEDTEREKRDLITVVSRLKEDAAQREDEIKTLRANLKQARQDHQTLETQLRELRSTETSTRFRLESLQQQLNLAKEEAERSAGDLAAKSEEFARYRRTQHTELAQLQAAHDTLVQTHAATESSLKALQSAHNAQTHQLTQALARVQDLTGQLAEQEATYSSEAAGLKRLVEMMEDRERQAKEIVENIENEWATVGERADRREAVLREEIEAQKERAEAAERKVDDLQKVLDRMDRGEFPVPGAGSASVPVTPMRGQSTPAGDGSAFLSPGLLGLSPTIAMASRVQRGGKTFTEVYTEYVKLQEELAMKTMEYDQMADTLQGVLSELEQRAPVLTQQREEYSRLQAEATLLANQLADAIAERDSNATVAEENAQKLVKTIRENELLNRQLNDLGRQVQTLLKELGRRKDPTIPSDEELEADESTRPAENIEAVIENNLVLFCSIPALQEQNQKLLRIVRELGAKLEAEEKEYREQVEAEQVTALQEAYAAIKELQQQLENNKKHSETTIQAYIKERDALKSMLARERGLAVAGIHGHSDGMAVDSDIAKELSEVASQFEAYKIEMNVDSSKLRDELLNVRHDAAHASAQLAKANAKIEYLNERLRMLQEQNTMQNRDLNNLASRNQELIDKYSRVDLQCGQLTTELLTANATIDQLRNESANLRAEKKIWEDIQARLIEENKSLAIERSHLADLMANVQRMHNDLERSGENDRRRLESQIQMLENQSQDLRTQLSQERDTVRQLTLHKDLELRELRMRIDRTSEEHVKTREALVSAQTSKTHLEEQVDRLTRQLQGNEEKLAVYERRNATAIGSVPESNENLSQEQQLESEVAELRSRLKVAEMDLAAARSHVQQYQEISQANEAALAALNSTYDEYKASTEAQIAKHESESHALQEKLQSVQQELQQLSTKNIELQRALETERAAWIQDKKALEDTIVDLTTSEQSTESERTAHTNEVRQLEERARTAEDRYGREVLSHAESIRTVESLRQQLTAAQVSARESLAAAETAQVKLGASEASWKQQKEALDKEIGDLKDRIKDLAAQNTLLHKHLDDVSSQAAKIQRAADSSAAPVTGDGSPVDDADTRVSELRSVVAYLRKEKEIVDLQLELSKQECTRLRTQIDHLSANLEETRKTLSEERERAVQAATSEAQHAELVEKINQLTILRESNATLRADCELHAKRARSLETQLQQLTSELEPTREQLRIAKAELDAHNETVKRLEEEARKWQERNAQLLTKYDRIDPAEVQALKDRIEALTAAQAKTDAEANDKIRRMQDIVKANKGIAQRSIDRAENEKKALSARVSELEQQLKEIIAERDQLKESNNPSQVDELNQQVQKLLEEKAQLEQRLASEPSNSAALAEKEAELSSLKQERDALLAEKSTWVAASGTPEGMQQQWEVEKAELVKARDDAEARVKRAQERVDNLASQLKDLRLTQTKIASQKQQLEKELAAEKDRALSEQKTAIDAAVEKVKSELQVASGTSEEASKHAQELRELEERLTKKHQEELRKHQEEFKKHQDAFKRHQEGLRKQLEELKKAAEAAKASASNSTPPDTKAAIDQAVAAREQEIKATHEQEITQAVERGRMEATAKSKLKDAQLVKVQAKVKDLEWQIEELKKTGVQIPLPPAGAAGPVKLGPAASTSAIKPTIPSTAVPPASPLTANPSTTPATTPQKPRGTAGLPMKPGTGNHPLQTSRAARGRGAPAAAGLSIRGAAPTAVPEGQAAPSDGSGVSIIGAAGKRAREDGEGSGDDSLAKRLKPEGVAGRPPIQRNRVQTPTGGS